MNRLQKLVAFAMCLWLLLGGGAVHALISLQAEHEHEHEQAAMAYTAHDAGDHRHADEGIELFSKLFGQPGFDQLTSAWITSRCLVLAQDVSSTAPAYLVAHAASVTPIPPPGPPPRAVAVHWGGGFPR
jgi:hypothetical protein